MSPNSIANWTVDDLAPALQQAGLPVPIYGFDLGWGSGSLAAQLARGESRQLSGIAWHCYFGSPLVMNALQAVVPGINQIVDECSPGITPISTSEVVISSLRDWASEVALWNLALDPTGGPVQLPNSGCPGCYGLAVVDETRHIFYPTSAYYELGQASVAIEPGAHRIASGTFATYNYLKPGVNFISPNIDDVAVENPDGTRALIAYNNGIVPAAFAVVWHGEYFAYTLPVGATVTFTWNR
jgi:glucosylceramidase